MLQAVLVLLLAIIGSLTLLGLIIVMAIGAIMPKRSPVTSWPMNEEASFQPFEQRTASSHSQAWVFSIAAGLLVFIAVVGIYKGVDPEIRDLSKDMNMSNLTKKTRTEEPAPTPTPAVAPKADEAKPAEAPPAATP